MKLGSEKSFWRPSVSGRGSGWLRCSSVLHSKQVELNRRTCTYTVLPTRHQLHAPRGSGSEDNESSQQFIDSESRRHSDACLDPSNTVCTRSCPISHKNQLPITTSHVFEYSKDRDTGQLLAENYGDRHPLRLSVS